MRGQQHLSKNQTIIIKQQNRMLESLKSIFSRTKIISREIYRTANHILEGQQKLIPHARPLVRFQSSASAQSIRDETNRGKFQSRISGRMTSTKYDEFEKSYRGCKSRPTDPGLAQDLEVLIGQMFHFSRITRNEVGHPQIVPDLARGVVLANLGQFVHYIERVYRLMDHFRTSGVEV